MSSSERRTSFLCYPISAIPQYQVYPGWLKILAPAQNALVQLTGSGQKIVTAQVRLHRHWALQVGDVLQDNFDNRLYFVQQLAIQSPHQLAWLEEVARPLPDTFDSDAIRFIWDDGVVDQQDYYPFVADQANSQVTAVSLANVGQPSTGEFLWQAVLDDFDVWVKLESVGTGTATGFAGLRCTRGGNDSVSVGLNYNGIGQYYVYRIDEISGTVHYGPPTFSASTVPYFRLQRQGASYRGFYAASFPTQESSWTLITPDPTVYLQAGLVQLGVGGFRLMTGGTYTMKFKHFLNWTS